VLGAGVQSALRRPVEIILTLDGEIIKDASFVGSGCCISKASASLLTENVKGKSKAEAEQMFERVRDLVTTGKAAGDVGKLAVFAAYINIRRG